LWDGVFTAVEGAAEIYVQDFFPELSGGLFQSGAREPAGVVDEAFEFFVGADSVVDQGGALGFVADVDGMEFGAVAFATDSSGGFYAAVLLDVGEDYKGAFSGGLAGAGEADALGSAGDDDHFVF
jgi:hypothetical protein